MLLSIHLGFKAVTDTETIFYFEYFKCLILVIFEGFLSANVKSIHNCKAVTLYFIFFLVLKNTPLSQTNQCKLYRNITYAMLQLVKGVY